MLKKIFKKILILLIPSLIILAIAVVYGIGGYLFEVIRNNRVYSSSEGITILMLALPAILGITYIVKFVKKKIDEAYLLPVSFIITGILTYIISDMLYVEDRTAFLSDSVAMFMAVTIFYVFPLFIISLIVAIVLQIKRRREERNNKEIEN